jgi:hypothetical protein
MQSLQDPKDHGALKTRNGVIDWRCHARDTIAARQLLYMALFVTHEKYRNKVAPLFDFLHRPSTWHLALQSVRDRLNEPDLWVG